MDKLWTRVKERARGGKSKNKKKKRLSRAERLIRENNAKSRALFLEILFYVAFLVILVISSNNNRDARASMYKESILKAIDPGKNISKVTTSDLMWNWTQSSLMSFLENGLNKFEISDAPDKEKALYPASYKMGPVRFRQHRVKDGLCIVHDLIRNLTVRCSTFWSSNDREMVNYGTQWKSEMQNESAQGITDVFFSDTVTHSETKDTINMSSAWTYRTWSEIGGLPITGDLGIYPAGGYIVDIADSKNGAQTKLRHLQDNHWVDNRTRVVMIEVTLYSPNVNLFAMVTAMFEFMQAEVIISNLQVYPFRLFAYLGNYPVAMMACDYLVYIAIVWFVLREISKIYHERLQYFKKFWNIIEFINVIASVASVVLHVGRIVVSDTVSKEVRKATDQFYNFQTLAKWDELFGSLVAVVCFLSIIQMLHLLRFNKRMSMLGATMMRSISDLCSFALIFFLMLFAFISFSYITFGAFMNSYMSLLSTFKSLMLLTIGQMEYELMNDVSRVLTPTFIFLYSLFVVFILLNILVSILMDAFAEVRDDVKKQPNDHELIDYILATAASFLWSYSPFRVVWAVGCKTGLVSESQPASRKPVSKPASKEECEPQVVNKLHRPALFKPPRSCSETMLKEQFSVINFKLDKITEKVDFFLSKERVSTDLLQIEIIDEEKESKINNKEVNDQDAAKIDEGIAFMGSRLPNDAKLEGRLTDKLNGFSNENEAKKVKWSIPRNGSQVRGNDCKMDADCNTGKQRLHSISLELCMELEDLFSREDFLMDQRVPELRRVYTQDDVSDTLFGLVPDMHNKGDGNDNGMNTLKVQAEVIAEFQSDNDLHKSNLTRKETNALPGHEENVEENENYFDIFRSFDEDLDEVLFLDQSFV